MFGRFGMCCGTVCPLVRMRIYTRAEIGLQPPRQVSGSLVPTGWVLHWVGGTGMAQQRTEAESKSLIRSLQQDAFQKGYSDIQYSFFVDPAGRVFEGRGWVTRSAANGTTASNGHLWSVCYLGGPGVRFTPEARQSLLSLCQAGARRAPAVALVVPHRTVQGVSTACPGAEGVAVARWLQDNLHNQDIPDVEEDDVTIVAQPKPASFRGRTPTARAVPALGVVLLENGARLTGDKPSGKNHTWRDPQVPARGKLIGIAARPDGKGIVGLYDLGQGETATYEGFWK